MSTEEPASTDDPEPSRRPRPQVETLVYRALCLRCPRCGKGKLFRGWFRMNHRCPVCRLLIDRPAGFYLGSIYINYGVTAWTTLISFMLGRFYFKISGWTMGWILGTFCLVFPVCFFRYSRALWLALDCQFDSSVLDEKEPEENDETREK